MSTTLNERFVVCHIQTKEVPLEVSRAINKALIDELCKMLGLTNPLVDTDEMGAVPCDDIGVINTDVTVNYFNCHVSPVVAVVFEEHICSQGYIVMNSLIEQFEGLPYETKVLTVDEDTYNCLLFTVNMRSVVEVLADINREDVCLVNAEYIETFYGNKEAG
jgi:hypothetical protein